MDHPAGRKAHARPVAVTGGWGIYATFVLFVGGGALLIHPIIFALPGYFSDIEPYIRNILGLRKEVAAILAGTTLVFIVGAIDDVRPLGPWAKLAAQVVATLPLIAVGVMIRGFLPLPLGIALTIGWVVLLTNSFNLLDNMDGLSASVALVVCGVLALAARQGGELWLPAPLPLFRGRPRRLPGLQFPPRLDVHGRCRQPDDRLFGGRLFDHGDLLHQKRTHGVAGADAAGGHGRPPLRHPSRSSSSVGATTNR